MAPVGGAYPAALFGLPCAAELQPTPGALDTLPPGIGSGDASIEHAARRFQTSAPERFT
jgi:hypothetical protein